MRSADLPLRSAAGAPASSPRFVAAASAETREPGAASMPRLEHPQGRGQEGRAPLKALRSALQARPSGPCPPDPALTELLARAWPSLHGTNTRAMGRGRLLHVPRDLVWAPPLLSFRVAEEPTAHAAPTSRSAAAHWQVDTQDGSAWVARTGFVELPPKESASDLALALVRQIAADVRVPGVVRKSKDLVVIRPGEVPGLDLGPLEPLPGRHMRFRSALEKAMEKEGFRRLAPYRFEREPPIRVTSRASGR